MLPTYLCTSWHVTQIIITEEGMYGCLFWIAEDLPLKINPSMSDKQFLVQTQPDVFLFLCIQQLADKVISN